ncbi:hypothetical protein C2845_PM07G20290 [Panicum miliaceum]|uniref:Uncharacterized protein n=1 Tax=Panicum miliaceum TaxID=4540 RepID=A0A3L6SI31_PANMI|nr:hypothetical protein C2845_PM07G20290 [Panicum miliaceum]
MAVELGFAVEAVRPLHRRISVLQSFGVFYGDAFGRFQFPSISGDGGEYGVVSGEIFRRSVTSSFGAKGERTLSSPVSQVLAGLLAWPATAAASSVNPRTGVRARSFIVSSSRRDCGPFASMLQSGWRTSWRFGGWTMLKLPSTAEVVDGEWWSMS